MPIEPSKKDDAIAGAERWIAEKGVEWQTLVMTQMGGKAQAIASLSIFVPSFLVGGGTISAAIKLQGVDPSQILGPIVLGALALTSSMLAFGSSISILYPANRFGFLTPPR